MKLTNRQLKRIIKEEVSMALKEAPAEKDPCKSLKDINLKLTYIYAPTDPALVSKLGAPPPELGNIEQYKSDHRLRRELVLQMMRLMERCPDNPAEMASS